MTREEYMLEEIRQNLAKTDRSYYNQEEWLEKFLDDKGAFYDVSESNDSENNNENYLKIQKQPLVVFFKVGLPKNFANFTRKHQCWSFFSKKLQALWPAPY